MNVDQDAFRRAIEELLKAEPTWDVTIAKMLEEQPFAQVGAWALHLYLVDRRLGAGSTGGRGCRALSPLAGRGQRDISIEETCRSTDEHFPPPDWRDRL
jgi:hypothetical protein